MKGIHFRLNKMICLLWNKVFRLMLSSFPSTLLKKITSQETSKQFWKSSFKLQASVSRNKTKRCFISLNEGISETHTNWHHSSMSPIYHAFIYLPKDVLVYTASDIYMPWLTPEPQCLLGDWCSYFRGQRESACTRWQMFRICVLQPEIKEKPTLP